MFAIFGTETYQKGIKKWPKPEQQLVSKLYKELAENPFLGKQLTYRFLREKKIGGRRIYYLVYKDLQLVLLIATSGKKDQQNTIDHIKKNFGEYRKYAEKLSKQA